MDYPKFKGFTIALSRKGGYIAVRYGRVMYRARTENDLYSQIEKSPRKS